MKNIYKINGFVQHYAWGGVSFIPELLHINNVEGLPYAEYWLGNHPLNPCTVVHDDGKVISTKDFFANLPEDKIGSSIQYFNESVPYLFKILDIKDMLSIQVHPTKVAARIEFERENHEHIPINAPNRNYKDANHKPEMAVALTELFLLHGFKVLDKAVVCLQDIPELEFIIPMLQEHGHEEVYKLLMGMPQHEVNTILRPLLDRILPLYKLNKLLKGDEHYWAAKAAITYNTEDKIDRGIFSIYLLNLVQLQKGKSIFQSAGVPHAYLEGKIVEIMANSDNVLRGGLTKKNIDVKELMKHVKFTPVIPHISTAVVEEHEHKYLSLAEEFALSSYLMNEVETTDFTTHSIEIIFVLNGEISIKNIDYEKSFKKGEAALLLSNANYLVEAKSNEAYFFRAKVNRN